MQQNNSNTRIQKGAAGSVSKSTSREGTLVVRLGTEITDTLMRRTRLAIAMSEERITIRQLISEGLELRVSQLEKKLAKAGAA